MPVSDFKVPVSMTDTPLGCAMKLYNGSLSVIVAAEWKEQLLALLTQRGIKYTRVQQLRPIENPLDPSDSSRMRPVEFEIITRGDELDFVQWSDELGGFSTCAGVRPPPASKKAH